MLTYNCKAFRRANGRLVVVFGLLPDDMIKLKTVIGVHDMSEVDASLDFDAVIARGETEEELDQVCHAIAALKGPITDPPTSEETS